MYSWEFNFWTALKENVFFPVDSCETHQFKCEDGSKCIDLSLRCNGGDIDCSDESDENNCPGKVTSLKSLILSTRGLNPFK